MMRSFAVLSLAFLLAMPVICVAQPEPPQQMFDFELSVNTEYVKVDLNSDRTTDAVVFTYTIKNTGHVHDNYALLVTVEENWRLPAMVSNPYTEVLVPPGGSSTVVVNILIPDKVRDGDNAVVQAEAYGQYDPDNKHRSVSSEIEIFAPSVVLTGITFDPEEPRDGDKVKVTAHLKNWGRVDEVNVTVRFSAPGGVKDSVVEVPVIRAGDSIEVSTEWKAMEGRNEIDVRVEAAFAHPSRDHGFELLNVGADMEAMASLYGPIIIFLVIAVVGLFLLRRRKGRR